MQVETVAISELSNDPANVRTHSEAQISKLMGSLRRWGQTLPLLVDQNNVVRIGNARLEAARRLGWQHVQIVRLSLSPSEWTALAIADNKLHDDSSFDTAALTNVLNALRAEDAELAQAAGYSLDEIAGLFGSGDGISAAEAPAYIAYQVREGNQKGYFTRIGAAWSNKDGKGFNIQLDAVPLDGRITLRLASEKKD